ncbi:MAG: nodulation protein NfeD [Oligoflexales bacterium]|nr:nodulation protein NfeD [Oligoflexales bacterium]
MPSRLGLSPIFPSHILKVRQVLLGLFATFLCGFAFEGFSEEKETEAADSRPSISQHVETLKIERILVLSISSSINPATLNYIESSYQKATSEGFDMVLIKLNTPGGLVTTTKAIMGIIGDSNIPTTIWVSPEGASATSAGAIIASSAHVLLMASGTNIGAATPIQMSEDIKNKDLRNKAINDLVALVQSLAELRGRNTELFAKIIKDASSYTSREALKENLIDGVIDTRSELADGLDGRKILLKGKTVSLSCQQPEFVSVDWDLGQRLMNIFADPNAAYILFLIGAALIYLELQAPGGFLAGLLGLICLILSGIGFQILPVNLGALGLLLVAFVLFVMEAYITSYGLLALAGLVSLITGSLFLFRTDDAYISISMELIIAAVVTIMGFVVFVGGYIFKDMRQSKAKDNYYSLIGKSCVISSCLEADQESGQFLYQVKVGGEIWKARSHQNYEVGQSSIIIADQDEDMTLGIGDGK